MHPRISLQELPPDRTDMESYLREIEEERAGLFSEEEEKANLNYEEEIKT